MRITPWRTTRGRSEYHVRKSRKGVVALVVHCTFDAEPDFVHCQTCNSFECEHVRRVRRALFVAETIP